MSEKRIVPSNLMSWPRIKTLLPDQKLIVYHLWSTSPSSAGCWLLDTAGFSAALSLREEALLDALAEFERRRLVMLDQETGEIFICDWFRWHTFPTAARRQLLKTDMRRVESRRLEKAIRSAVESSPKPIFSEESDICDLSEDKRREAGAAEPGGYSYCFS